MTTADATRRRTPSIERFDRAPRGNGNGTSDLRLITIPISHYCEKARWALGRAGLRFREEAHLQVLHRYHVRRAGGGTTAPVLVTPDGVLADSTEILEWVDARLAEPRRLYPDADAAEVRALEDRFDDELGPHGRRWMYHRVLPHDGLVRAYGATGVSGWERAALPVLLPAIKPVLRRFLGLGPRRGGVPRACGKGVRRGGRAARRRPPAPRR